MPNPMNPQALNRYTYALKNPLKYMDPNGHQVEEALYQTQNNLQQLAQSLGPYGFWFAVGALAVSGAALLEQQTGCFSKAIKTIKELVDEATPRVPTPEDPSSWLPKSPKGGKPNKPPLKEIVTVVSGATAVAVAVASSRGDPEDPTPTTPEPATPPRMNESGTSPSWEPSPSPSTTHTLGVGGASYTPSTPTAIGNTGFTNWGITSSGAQVISINDPSTYEPWEWW